MTMRGLRFSVLACVSLALPFAGACADKGDGSKATVADTPGTFGAPPGASTETSPCAVALPPATVRPLNHEGHGDLAVEIPPGYAALQNPCPKTPETVARGKSLFAEHCARCHGPDGDPKAATQGGLKPPAKTLTVGGFTDPYVFWRIQEGGAFEPFSSQMPSFKTLLTDDDAWMVTRHVLSLTGADATPLAPSMALPVAIDGAVQVSWRLASACKSLKLDRKKDTGTFALAYTLAGFVTEYHDTAATAPGQYCYRIACETGDKVSPPSGEVCLTL